MDVDLTTEPLGTPRRRLFVPLRVWPTTARSSDHRVGDGEKFKISMHVFPGDDEWRFPETEAGAVRLGPMSHVHPGPPYFEGLSSSPIRR